VALLGGCQVVLGIEDYPTSAGAAVGFTF